MSEIDVSRCRSRIKQFAEESDTTYQVPVSVGYFSAGVGEPLELTDWAARKFEGHDLTDQQIIPSIKRVADALDVKCNGCREGCHVLSWLPLLALELKPLTQTKPDYTSEEMPQAPGPVSGGVDDVEETIELRVG